MSVILSKIEIECQQMVASVTSLFSKIIKIYLITAMSFVPPNFFYLVFTPSTTINARGEHVSPYQSRKDLNNSFLLFMIERVHESGKEVMATIHQEPIQHRLKLLMSHFSGKTDCGNLFHT